MLYIVSLSLVSKVFLVSEGIMQELRVMSEGIGIVMLMGVVAIKKRESSLKGK